MEGVIFTQEECLNATCRIATITGQQIPIVAQFLTSTNTVTTNRQAACSATIPVSFDLAFITTTVICDIVVVIAFFITSDKTIPADGFQKMHFTCL